MSTLATVPCPTWGYRREVPKWERRDVTICIAAVCDENVAPKIIVCSDNKTSGTLGSAETMMKIRHVGAWKCLTAGLDTDILATTKLFRRDFEKASSIDETNILSIVRAALNERKREKVEELIQGKFAIPYSDFLATGKTRFPDDQFRAVMMEVEQTEIDAEFILCGFAGQVPFLVKTDANCRATIREGFAAVGEGAYLAQASLLSRAYDNFDTFARALYAVYEAKKYSEGAPTVGKVTTLTILHADGKFEILSRAGDDWLKQQYKDFGPKELPDRLTPVKADFFTEVQVPK